MRQADFTGFSASVGAILGFRALEHVVGVSGSQFRFLKFRRLEILGFKDSCIGFRV